MGLFDSFKARPPQPERSGEGAAPPAGELLSDSPASTSGGAQVLGNYEGHSIPGLAFPEVWSACCTALTQLNRCSAEPHDTAARLCAL